MGNSEYCCRPDCSLQAVTVLAAETLCLEHFCSCCYQTLDALDQPRKSTSAKPVPLAEKLLLADECARRALDICLCAKALNNLERARLLDILLWCGEIVRCSEPANLSLSSLSVGKRFEKPKLTSQKSGKACSF